MRIFSTNILQSLLILLSLLSFIMVFTTIVVQPIRVDAQQDICEGAGGTWNASSGKCTKSGSPELFDPPAGQNSIFQNVVNILLFVTGAISVLMLIIGGIRYTVSAGDQAAVTSAKNTILYSIVGIVLAFAAYGIATFVITRLTSS